MGLRSLNDPAGQAAVEDLLLANPEVKLIVIDNLSSLCGGAENDAESWQSMQSFLLKLRQAGFAVLLVHHSGKTGTQRGTSRKEDVLDTVIQLKRPKNYVAEDGARFEVHFEKSRAVSGAAVEPIELQLSEDHAGRLSWSVRSLDQSRMEQVAKMLEEGLTQKEIAEELGLNKSTISRAVKRAHAHGLISKENNMTTRTR